ncbi:uncharacterized protein [Dysidea avara]|uniref:uncharacterized protein n=1 Tax=Dysidea avara TaxID=196820 RepID=UPI00331CB298
MSPGSGMLQSPLANNHQETMTPESSCVPEVYCPASVVSTDSQQITSTPDTSLNDSQPITSMPDTSLLDTSLNDNQPFTSTPLTNRSSSTPGSTSTRKRRRMDSNSDSSSSSLPPPATGSSTLVDEREGLLCEEFVVNTCGCKKTDGRPCSSQFTTEHLIEMRAQASLMTHDELDMVILGSLMTTLNRSENIIDGRHKAKRRQRNYSDYMHNRVPVCSVTFGFLYGIGPKTRLQSIRSHYLECGMTPRVHGNTKCLPHNAMPFDVINAAVKFLQNYAEQHAILLPGRIPGYKRDNMKLLPSSSSKKVSFLV